jgi:hypothetical protein
MVDLSMLSEVSSIKAVDLFYEENTTQRNYLGLSQIGHRCDRWIWLKYNGTPEANIDGRVLRLFKLGETIESQMAVDLQSTGFRIHSPQKSVIFTQDDLQLEGHIDGIIEGLIESKQPHLWECKSASNKRFQELLKVGYEKWDAKYCTQVHVYAFGLKLNRIYATVYNKDNSELYQERIKTDKSLAMEALHRTFSIMRMHEAPVRLSQRADWYECKYCGYHDHCFPKVKDTQEW